MKLKPTIIDICAFLLCAIFITAGIIVSLHRFWQYEASYIDFGQYDQAIWKVSRFQEPIVDHFIHGKINVLGDHVTPSIFLISPLYWFTDKSEMILIVQAIAAGLSGLVLYDIAKTVLKRGLLSLSVLISYFLFVGLQNAVITEFHELTVMTLPLMLTIWAITKNKTVLYFIFLVITLGFKEVIFSLGVGIGVAIFLLNKRWRKIGIATILISSLWGFIAFKIIIPHFSKDGYLYASSFPDSFTGILFSFVDHPEKRRTLSFSFLSFLYLPIFAPEFWLMIIQDYASRFIPQNFVTRWNLGMHYNAESAVILATSSVYGLKYLLKYSLFKKYTTLIAIILIVNSLFLFRFVLHGPFMLALNPSFYKHTAELNFLNDLVKKIPKNASVMSQNNLASHLTHQDVKLVSADYKIIKPEYILIDIREGQNPNDYYGTTDIKDVNNEILIDPNYKVIYKTKEQFIFRRIK